jgi:hypothetical protein
MYPTGFDTALICRSGHIVTHRLNNFPHLKAQFCAICGAETLAACPGCQKPIDGENMVDDGSMEPPHYKRPAFCKHCSKAYPWTEEALQVAKELAAESDLRVWFGKQLLNVGLGANLDLAPDGKRFIVLMPVAL